MSGTRETLFESLAVPDVVTSMQQLTLSSQANLTALQAIARQLGVSNPLVYSSAASSPLAAIAGNAMLSLPLPYDQLMQVVLAASKVGEVFPYFERTVTLVPAGQTAEVTTQIPTGDMANVVYVHKMRTDISSSEFLVTLQSDDLPSLVYAVPMTYEVDILGAFLPPVRTRGTHILTNNDTVDITFTQETQLVIMTSDFVKSVWRPIVEGQFGLLGDIAQIFSAVKGGA